MINTGNLPPRTWLCAGGREGHGNLTAELPLTTSWTPGGRGKGCGLQGQSTKAPGPDVRGRSLVFILKTVAPVEFRIIPGASKTWGKMLQSQEVQQVLTNPLQRQRGSEPGWGGEEDGTDWTVMELTLRALDTWRGGGYGEEHLT